MVDRRVEGRSVVRCDGVRGWAALMSRVMRCDFIYVMLTIHVSRVIRLINYPSLHTSHAWRELAAVVLSRQKSASEHRNHTTRQQQHGKVEWTCLRKLSAIHFKFSFSSSSSCIIVLVVQVTNLDLGMETPQDAFVESTDLLLRLLCCLHMINIMYVLCDVFCATYSHIHIIVKVILCINYIENTEFHVHVNISICRSCITSATPSHTWFTIVILCSAKSLEQPAAVAACGKKSQ